MVSDMWGAPCVIGQRLEYGEYKACHIASSFRGSSQIHIRKKQPCSWCCPAHQHGTTSRLSTQRSGFCCLQVPAERASCWPTRLPAGGNAEDAVMNGVQSPPQAPRVYPRVCTRVCRRSCTLTLNPTRHFLLVNTPCPSQPWIPAGAIAFCEGGRFEFSTVHLVDRAGHLWLQLTDARAPPHSSTAGAIAS